MIKTAFVYLLLVGVFLPGCAGKQDFLLPAATSKVLQAGDPLSIEHIDGYAKTTAKLLVWWTGMSEKIPISSGVDMYRIVYLTESEVGELIEVSGLLGVPRGHLPPKSVVSWQHGTAFKHSDAPSTPTPDQGVLVSLLFAGDGSILLAPDYIGFGHSRLPQTYYYLPTTIGSTRDLIMAAKAIFLASELDFPDSLFLAGHSQGGHATMAIARDLELSPIAGLNLLAAASNAGPIDLDGFSLENTLKGEARSASTYMALMLNSMARIYAEDMSAVFRAPYDTLIPEMLNGDLNLSGAEVAAKLPDDPKKMFLDEFLDNYQLGRRGWVGSRLDENDLDNWQPQTPLRMYYGSKDIDVSPYEAASWAVKWKANGLDVQAIDVGDFDHNQSVVEAAPLLRLWFNSFAIERQ